MIIIIIILIIIIMIVVLITILLLLLLIIVIMMIIINISIFTTVVTGPRTYVCIDNIHFIKYKSINIEYIKQLMTYINRFIYIYIYTYVYIYI